MAVLTNRSHWNRRNAVSKFAQSYWLDTPIRVFYSERLFITNRNIVYAANVFDNISKLTKKDVN